MGCKPHRQKGGEIVTNSILLKQRIKDSGFRNGYIAEQLGISTATLRFKVNGTYEFKQTEIAKLCELLKITKSSERESIFFAKQVS